MGDIYDMYSDQMRAVSQLPFMNDRMNRLDKIGEQISQKLKGHDSARSRRADELASNVFTGAVLLAVAFSVGVAAMSAHGVAALLTLVGGLGGSFFGGTVIASSKKIREKIAKKYDEKHVDEIADLKLARQGVAALRNHEHECFFSMSNEAKAGLTGLDQMLHRDPEIRTILFHAFCKSVGNPVPEEPRRKSLSPPQKGQGPESPSNRPC